MKVSELMAALKESPPDYDVTISDVEHHVSMLTESAHCMDSSYAQVFIRTLPIEKRKKNRRSGDK